MACPRHVALLLTASLVVSPSLARAQPEPKQADAVQKIQDILDQPFLLDGKDFQKELPLAQFLAALEAKLPQAAKLTLRLDEEAFGKEGAKVAATAVRLPPALRKTSLRAALDIALARLKVKADYRLDAAGIVVTTPSRALSTIIYDIRDLVQKGEVPVSADGWNSSWKKLSGEPAQRAAAVVRALLDVVDAESGVPAANAAETIEIVNAAKLSVRASGSRHAAIAEALQFLRRLADLAVIAQARLYEVDEAFYTRVKNAKHVPLEELERQFLEGKGPKDDTFQLLAKQKLVLTGEPVKRDNGGQAALLSWHRVLTYLPSPEQVRKGQKSRQTILEGVSFLAEMRVSPDRRWVRVKLTEKATQLQALEKIKVFDPKDQEVDAEVPFVGETVSTRVWDIPDGGTLLVPVAMRPPAVGGQERRWVLWITVRIYIEEEERLINGK
jgi:hypothetical protein